MPEMNFDDEKLNKKDCLYKARQIYVYLVDIVNIRLQRPAKTPEVQ